ncbi:MAG: polysaccharide pyruvyl transferase CsaB [Clostridia bacterium]|nr:polysaccharide pyruvyl transferase CsaB [Clostridia bacterium]
MRVLMATMKLDIGGAETHIVELSKALARQGVEVFVASNGGAYEKELSDAGVSHIRIPFHSKNPLCMKRAYRMLKQTILENKIDVVHAHARIPAFLCALLHKKLPFRFVTTAHWVFTTRFPYNLLTRWGDRSLAVSDDIKDYLVENYGLSPEQIRVTINGIDLEKFAPDTDYSAIAQEFGLVPGKTRIVYVSRMDTDRSLAAHKLIEAAPKLAAEIPNLEILIVGGGNDLTAIEAEANAVNDAMGKRVVITTGSRTDINRFVASGDLFIGVSRAALEAMACQKPSIIAGNEGYIGIYDESKLQLGIDTNFCCRGCQPVDTETLTADILTVLKAAPEEQAALGEFARETVREHYSIDTMAADAMTMYQSMIFDTPINRTELVNLEQAEDYLSAHPITLDKGAPDVMISGYYGFHNSGDDSILKAMVESFRIARPGIRILALSNDPAETKAVYGIDAIHRFDLFRIVKNLRKTRLLLSGGGSLIQDVTSDKSLAYYLSIIWLSKKLGARVMLYANGIGPIRHEKNHKPIRHVLNRVDLITLREPSSLEELRRFGVTEPEIRITADPAFTLTAATPERGAELLKQAGIPKGRRYCVISLRPWRNSDPNLEKIVAEAADYIRIKYEMEVLFVPMQNTRDLPIAEKTAALMKYPGALLRSKPNPAELLALVGGAEFVIGMRLHTLIYAARMGTPVIGLTYDPKVDSTMDYLNQHYVESAKRLNPLTLRRYIDEIIRNHDRLCRDLSEASERSLRKAEENVALALSLLDRAPVLPEERG